MMEEALSSLRNQNIGLYLKALDHECTSDVGWLFYSARQQDEAQLENLISSHLGELIGLKWKQVRTTDYLDGIHPLQKNSLMAQKCVLYLLSTLSWVKSKWRLFSLTRGKLSIIGCIYHLLGICYQFVD
jgi:hypothetical protein